MKCFFNRMQDEKKDCFLKAYQVKKSNDTKVVMSYRVYFQLVALERKFFRMFGMRKKFVN